MDRACRLLRRRPAGSPGFINWYRIVAVGDNILNVPPIYNGSTDVGSTDYYLTLSGPDWPANADPRAAWAIAYEKSVIGVYTTTFESGSCAVPGLDVVKRRKYEIRISKSETNSKHKIQMTGTASAGATCFCGRRIFEIRLLDLFRISIFGFRISLYPGPGQTEIRHKGT